MKNIFLIIRVVIIVSLLGLTRIEAMDPPGQKNCTINLMWLNKQPNSNPYIFPEKLTKFEKIKTVELLRDWIKGNPTCNVNFWYDKNTVSDEQLGNTMELLQQADLADLKINLQNVRDLKTVQANPKVFENAISFYYQVDLLKAIIADEMTDQSENNPRYAVVADLNIIPWENDILLKDETLNQLDEYGFVISKAEPGSWAARNGGLENGFFILDGQNVNMKIAHKKAIIDVGLKLAYNGIMDPNKKVFDQTIYPLYKDVLLPTYFLLNGRYKLPRDISQCHTTKLGSMYTAILGDCPVYTIEEIKNLELAKIYNLNDFYPFYTLKINPIIYGNGRTFKDVLVYDKKSFIEFFKNIECSHNAQIDKYIETLSNHMESNFGLSSGILQTLKSEELENIKMYVKRLINNAEKNKVEHSSSENTDQRVVSNNVIQTINKKINLTIERILNDKEYKMDYSEEYYLNNYDYLLYEYLVKLNPFHLEMMSDGRELKITPEDFVVFLDKAPSADTYVILKDVGQIKSHFEKK